METKITTTEFARLMIASNARGAKKGQFSFTESDCRAVFGNAFINEAMTIFKNELITYEGGVDIFRFLPSVSPFYDISICF